MERLEVNLSRAELLAIIEKQRVEFEALRKIIEGLQRKQLRPHAPHSSLQETTKGESHKTLITLPTSP